MYKIRGSDNNEYGPITADQVRQWIRENRLNQSSLVERVDAPGWKPLGQFPEFADVLPLVGGGIPGPMSGGVGGHTRSSAQGLVKGPAISLLVFSGMMVLLGFVSLIGGPTFFGLNQHQELPAEMPEADRKSVV